MWARIAPRKPPRRPRRRRPATAHPTCAGRPLAVVPRSRASAESATTNPTTVQTASPMSSSTWAAAGRPATRRGLAVQHRPTGWVEERVIHENPDRPDQDRNCVTRRSQRPGHARAQPAGRIRQRQGSDKQRDHHRCHDHAQTPRDPGTLDRQQPDPAGPSVRLPAHPIMARTRRRRSASPRRRRSRRCDSTQVIPPTATRIRPAAMVAEAAAGDTRGIGSHRPPGGGDDHD